MRARTDDIIILSNICDINCVTSIFPLYLYTYNLFNI